MRVDSLEDVEEIPEHAYDIGFNDYYKVSGSVVAVPNKTVVPDSWTLISE
jgi:hypothetical protein